jgi:hypothetical protein
MVSILQSQSRGVDGLDDPIVQFPPDALPVLGQQSLTLRCFNPLLDLGLKDLSGEGTDGPMRKTRDFFAIVTYVYG